jgi:hypothetical protein
VIIQPSLRDFSATSSNPGVETPGYFQNVPLGHDDFGCLKKLKYVWKKSPHETALTPRLSLVRIPIKL